jgi:hypothetical protein
LPRHPRIAELRRAVLLDLFRRTALAYRTGGHPCDGYLEVGLTYDTLENSGERGAAVIDKLSRRDDMSQSLLIEMLDDIFVILFGDRQDVFSDADLKRYAGQQ